MKGADNKRENEVVVLVCCRCALTPKKLSWAYAGATFDSKKLMPSVACNLGGHWCFPVCLLALTAPGAVISQIFQYNFISCYSLSYDFILYNFIGVFIMFYVNGINFPTPPRKSVSAMSCAAMC